jgi:3-dehydroquinate synthase
MNIVEINVLSGSGRYPIMIAEQLLGDLSRLVQSSHLDERRMFVVSNPLVWRLHGRRLAKGLGDIEPILVPDGERYKLLGTVARVYESLVRANADRTATLIAFGGGVIGDMAGFAAATYLRGIPLIQIPTTLLAQVDASIGGKVGVNHPLGKNLIGAFYPPRMVVVDPTVLETLPRREFRSGLYEVIKYGVIASRPLFDELHRNLSAVVDRKPAALQSIVTECCRLKASIVSDDERESGPRRVLNFGHTAGHALETVTRYRRFRHGEAVGYGMLVAAALSARRGLLQSSDEQALSELIRQLGPLPPISDLSARETIEAMQRDKKVARGRLHYVLASGIGTTTIVDDVTDRELQGALKSVGLGK